MAASAAAILWSWRHGAVINYGDAIAHLHIARRIFDSRTPRFSQLGSVWLPLPHILLLPFVQIYSWWATGLAGVIPSALAYIASCYGIYRLARNWLSRAPSALALIFFALNPNLLYLQTTAMTEPLFLCEFIWIVVWLVEWRATLEDDLAPKSRGLQAIAIALVAAIFTRYDGWIIAFIAWSGVAITLLCRPARPGRKRLAAPTFWLATIAIAAAPILWFVYNSVCFGDWLFFARGPYSAHTIELHTAANAPGWPPHPGWHNPWVSFLFYLKVSLLDSVAAPGWGNFWGNLVLILAVLGFLAAFAAQNSTAHRRTFACNFLLWLPVPFYAWSVAYGSVPIFFPAWWPYTWYNTRYGLELLPALALGLGFAAQTVQVISGIGLRVPNSPSLQPAQRKVRFAPSLVLVLVLGVAGLNAYLLLRAGPIVYVEGTKNADARRPYDDAIPTALQSLLTLDPHATILMNTSLYPEIVSFTGIPLRQTINESDLGIYTSALADPAAHASIVVAFDGDEIAAAVKAHRAEFTLIGVYSAKNQPSAAIYASTNWLHRAPDFF
jgi:4-amino-4-deoxy-L-arabinose transferase-like glycosyltransferase